MQRFLRSAQTYFPFVRPLKFNAYNLGTRLFGWRVEPEFDALAGLSPVALALDVGGNWGQSIYALKRTAKPRRIISFEPNQKLADRLTRRFSGEEGVEIQPVALSDAKGSFTLHVPRYRNFVYDGLASLDERYAREWLNPDRVMNFDPAKLSIDKQHVNVIRLDDLNLSPDVIKMDVQGAEEAVVRGGLETYRRSRPISIIESPSSQLITLFAELGMRPYRYQNGNLHDDWRSSVNVLFADDGRRAQIERP